MWVPRWLLIAWVFFMTLDMIRRYPDVKAGIYEINRDLGGER